MSGAFRRMVVTAGLALCASASCGLLPDKERTVDSPSERAADDETAPPPMPDGEDGGSSGDPRSDEQRLVDLEQRIREQVDARPRTTGNAAASAAAEGAVLVALASLAALIAGAYRNHRVGLALGLSVLGLLVAIAAFVNSAT